MAECPLIDYVERMFYYHMANHEITQLGESFCCFHTLMQFCFDIHNLSTHVVRMSENGSESNINFKILYHREHYGMIEVGTLKQK